MNHPESSHAPEMMQYEEHIAETTIVPPYRSLLLVPTVSLAGNPIDRPDVETAAILGYN
jgi:hypothetical protein